jgi:hypothetical protein
VEPLVGEGLQPRMVHKTDGGSLEAAVRQVCGDSGPRVAVSPATSSALTPAS